MESDRRIPSCSIISPRASCEEGWSIKRLIRAIVLSRTYQLGSECDAAHARCAIRRTRCSPATSAGAWTRRRCAMPCSRASGELDVQPGRGFAHPAQQCAHQRNGQPAPAQQPPQHLPAHAAQLDAAGTDRLQPARRHRGHRQTRRHHAAHAGAVPAEQPVSSSSSRRRLADRGVHADPRPTTPASHPRSPTGAPSPAIRARRKSSARSTSSATPSSPSRRQTRTIETRRHAVLGAPSARPYSGQQ